MRCFRSCCLLALSLCPAIALAEPAELTGSTMGTTWSVKWTGDPASPADDLHSRIQSRLADINRLMSTYDPESELSRFNRSETTDWFPVSAETALVVARALEIAELSGGAFDPTVGPLVNLWSFGPDRRTFAPPADEDLQQAQTAVGYQRVSVRNTPPALRRSDPQIQLDLSAIAKGFGVDALSALLDEAGVTNYLVEIGGEVRARGINEDHPWRLGIERPAELREGLAATVELEHGALATSGDYRNYFVKDGERFSHTIDPATGRPVTHTLASVSVLADDCMTADGWATALLVLGPQKGLEFANQQQLAAYFLIRDGDGFSEQVSEAGRNRFSSIQPPAAAPAGRSDNLLSTFLLTATVFGIAILGLAVGVIFSNRQLKGTCGGLSAMKDGQGRSICEMCSTPPEQCDEFRKAVARSESSGDASSA